ncbi:MAG: formate/nitrite transporter family protein [Lachnospiraceae bacterium]|nr:formate/nitrite transporter family protein [Lachnospiraceae bacterium]
MNSPAEVAKNYVTIGKGKVNTPVPKMFILAVMAGMFIAMAGVGASTASATVENASLAKFLGAAVFPGGLAMVLIAGSELFTGNTLLLIPLMEKEVSVAGVLKNWVVVYIGNLVGSIIVSAICVWGGQLGLFSNGLAVSALGTAAAKCSMPFMQALIKGIGCNFLVCIAVWMSFAAKDIAGKFFALYLPILIFVVAGFEHSVANMYYITVGLFAKTNPAYLQAAADAGKDLTNLTWGGLFIGNLLPVTIGNIIGGGVLVGLSYWFTYLRKSK